MAGGRIGGQTRDDLIKVGANDLRCVGFTAIQDDFDVGRQAGFDISGEGGADLDVGDHPLLVDRFADGLGALRVGD